MFDAFSIKRCKIRRRVCSVEEVMGVGRQTTMQDGWVSASDPGRLCSFDYEAIQRPTKALLHQAARFLYIRRGRGTIEIDGTPYELVPNTIVAITPWEISDVTEVSETLQFIKIIYDYQYLNTILKGLAGYSNEGTELLRFLSAEPVAYLDSVQTAYVDELMEQLKRELGVESTRVAHEEEPFSQLYVCTKLIELMISYRRFVMASRGEAERTRPQSRENSIFSYLYAHSSEKLSLSQVAEVFSLSDSALSKQIAEQTGLSFPRLVSSIRIEKASDYLIYTDLTLDEIASLVGFTDAPHLSRHFSQRAGIPPNQYRKIYGKLNSKLNRSDKNVAFAITDYVYKHYAEEGLNASAVAAEFGVSATELNRLLLYYAEKNFETLLNDCRINKACELLASTDFLVIDVAVEVGYGNVKTFNMNFFKFKQMTPTEFRRRITLQKPDGSETGGKSGARR